MKKLMLGVVASLFCINLAVADSSAKTEGLTFDVHNASGSSFHVNSTVITGPNETMVIDTGFTKADALRIAAKVLDTGKPLKTIFISQADPDFYFGAEVLKQLFPEAKVITTPAVLAVIKKKVEQKVGFWGPKLGANGPVKPLMPEAYTASTINFDGTIIEIKSTEGLLAHRPYLWIPSEKAVLGNVAIFQQLHVWMADTQTPEILDAWEAQLETIKSLAPELVVAGHAKTNQAMDISGVDYTLNYINDFRMAVKSTNDSKELAAAMNKLYPDSGLGIALAIGSKVHKGEMKW